MENVFLTDFFNRANISLKFFICAGDIIKSVCAQVCVQTQVTFYSFHTRCQVERRFNKIGEKSGLGLTDLQALRDTGAY